jgi:hypothetical protein
LSHERDERWAYVVLVVLLVAFAVYRGAGASWFSGVSLRFPDIEAGPFLRNLPYLFAPLFAVLSEIWRRRRAKALKAEWERRAREEGLRREAEDVAVRFVSGARGTMRADARLTRAAMYLFDRSGRRPVMRLLLSGGGEGDHAVAGVSLAGGGPGERPRLRVSVRGPAAFEFEMDSPAADGWWADMRNSPSLRDRAPGETPEARDEPGF